MYRTSSPHSPSSPIFDAPEFPTLRRVKPLPKRRRTSQSDTSSLPPGSHSYHATPAGNSNGTTPLPSVQIPLMGRPDENGNVVPSGGMIVAGGNGLPPSLHVAGLPPIPLTLPGPDASPEELLAHADALQQYYMPILGAAAAGMGAGLSGLNGLSGLAGTGTGTGTGSGLADTAGGLGLEGNGSPTGDEGTGNGSSLQFGGINIPLPNLPLPHDGILQDLDPAHFAAQLQYAAQAAGDAFNAVGGAAGIPDLSTSLPDRERDSDSDHGDGDYTDHLTQPGNTKKRKVPANHFSHSQLGREDGDMVTGFEGGLGGQDDDEEAALSFRLDGIGGEGAIGGVDPTGAGPGPGGTATASEGSQNLRHLPQPNGKLSPPSSQPQNPQQFQQQHVNLARQRLQAKSKKKVYLDDGDVDMASRMSSVMSAVTLAGLQHKEMLKSRKRQLATVLSALTNSAKGENGKEVAGGTDTLALEQALSGINLSWGYSSYGGGNGVPEEGEGALVTTKKGKGDVKELKVRLSKRKMPRMARKLRSCLKENESVDEEVLVPEGDFTFVCHCETSDRLVATKQEVAVLRQKFEAELNRQATKAAKAAKAAKLAAAKDKNGTSPKGGRQKRIERERERERERQRARIAAGTEKEDDGGERKSTTTNTATTMTQTTTVPPPPPSPSPLPPTKGKNTKGKKKKRSALANASNPHHLKNYVPSRLPNSGGQHHGAETSAEDIWPLPLRFLSTEIPPKRRKGDANGKRSPERDTNSQPLSTVQLTNPAEEWVCAFCEYELFYGDDVDFRRAVRKRKAILKRRRRAREKAAAAASGKLSAKRNQGSNNDKENGAAGVGVGGASGDAEAEFDEEAYEKDVRSGLIKNDVGVLGALNKNRERLREGEVGYG